MQIGISIKTTFIIIYLVRPIPQKAAAPSLKTRGLLSFKGHSNVVLVVCEGGFGENLSHRGGVFD